MVKIARISLDKKGLTKFFSPNETRILELLWKKQEMTSNDIHSKIDDLSLPCIAGTLDRLVKSGFVKRKIDENENRVKYIYYPVGNRENVGIKISEKVIDSLVDTFGTATIDTIGKIRRGKLRHD